jgi:hypothetical protein
MIAWKTGIITDLWTGTTVERALAWWRLEGHRHPRVWIEDARHPATVRREY